ncbi:MAG: YdeI/OmpD-associated family protein [Candidatus Limnocylindrales bacterium]
MRFRTTLLRTGKTSTGFRVPDEVVAALGSGRRPAVTVTIRGYTYRSTVAIFGDESFLGISAEHRAGAGVAAGDELEVELELDTAPREVVVPADLQAALDADPTAAAFFAGLSYSNRLRHVLGIEGAKTAETRSRRIAKSVSMFHEGKA